MQFKVVFVVKNQLHTSAFFVCFDLIQRTKQKNCRFRIHDWLLNVDMW
jgi:hypothetical protein